MENTRINVRVKMVEAIKSRDTSLTDKEIEERARKIETSCFNFAVKRTSGEKILKKRKQFSWGTRKHKRKPKPVQPSWECLVFRNGYKNKCVNIIFNLNDKRNPGFIQRIVDKEHPLRDVAFLNPNEIYPELWKPIEDKLNKRIGPHERNFAAEEANDGIMPCGKCKSLKTTYYSLQTRSADEPMTNFFTCLSCGNKWKFC